MLNRQGRPTTPNQQAESDAAGTITGNRGLLMEEALIFEQGEAGRTGVDLELAAIRACWKLATVAIGFLVASLISKGQEKLALWLPGITANGPSSTLVMSERIATLLVLLQANR